MSMLQRESITPIKDLPHYAAVIYPESGLGGQVRSWLLMSAVIPGMI
jgi:hypothetical protein